MKSIVTALLVLEMLSGCAYTQKQSEIDPNASLYERLGKKPAISAVISDMTLFISQDERINGFFIGANIERINAQLTEQICEGAGGPCKYTGSDMYTLHTGMNITEAHFNALVDDLKKSLNKHGVPLKEQQELFTLLGSMQKDVVNH